MMSKKVSKTPPLDKKRSREFAEIAGKNYYLPAILVSEFLNVSDQTVRDWINRGDIVGSKLNTNTWQVSVASLKNFMLRKNMFIPGFNCPDIPDWSPETYDVIPREASLDLLNEKQSAAVLMKIAEVFNDKSIVSHSRRLKDLVNVINQSLTAVALHRGKKVE